MCATCSWICHSYQFIMSSVLQLVFYGEVQHLLRNSLYYNKIW
ncbi:unnamed protein product [Brassica rapa]|uniref:Uncharacterized protein n=2 Tax=Brassica TaxID=3705 RepID=A0A8D9GHE3_BRACM|nr:unnamed protein product [Brassica napus]CAG7880728.1 unnamed protein product [Brassica rapa]